MLIEDASTDARVRPFLRDWAARQTRPNTPGRVELIENETNLGFIGAVNRGLEVARAAGHPVVLLNSDAFVPAGWAGRLIAPMLADDSVATVTPMSNDAEIFSVPRDLHAHAPGAGHGRRDRRRRAGLRAGVGAGRGAHRRGLLHGDRPRLP